MTELEQIALSHLVEAWNAFLRLPTEHADDVTEFRHGIHGLQVMIMARPVRRQVNQINFRAKAGEDAQAKTGDASDDPVSRAAETSRQKGSVVEIADGCLHGGKEELAAADRHASVSHGTATAMEQRLSGSRKDLINPSSGQREIEVRTLGGATNQPATATKQRVNVHSQHEAIPPGQATVQNECVTVVGTERGTVVNPMNERCLKPAQCRFSHHPQKITCSACGSAWAAKAKVQVAA